MLLPRIFDANLFDDFMSGFSFPDISKELYGSHASHVMKTDVKENGDKYEVSVDLPGFDKDDVKVELKDGYLTISADKGLDKEDKKDKKYLRKERYEGSMSRSFYVGDEITQDDINASYKNGVLTLELPKKDQKKVEADTSHMIEVH